MKRKEASSEDEAKVLIESRRRCALCFGLKGDLSEHKGQIAHVDRDPTNSEFKNLAFLCLEHHDAYDSKTSQSKSYTPDELTTYRGELYTALKADGALWAGSRPRRTQGKGPSKPAKAPESISFEIYERRMQVYQAAKEIISYVLSSGTMELDRAFKFAQASDEAIFLFDDEIDAFLRELYMRAIRLRAIHRDLERLPVGEMRIIRANDESDILIWFTQQYDVLRLKMRNYLRLK